MGRFVMAGRLDVVGIGPGRAGLLTAEAQAALASAQLLFGYGPYLARVAERAGQARHISDNREELSRAQAALMAAAAGQRVAMVTGGDPGVFAMAAAVCEAIEHGAPEWRAVDLEIHPGITVMLALAARAGAVLGHDFCAISLSDNLKPWPIVQQRLRAAAGAGFAIALYNPISRARPWQLATAFALLAEELPAETPVIFGHSVAREAERICVVPLHRAADEPANMSSCIIIGTGATRIIDRGDAAPLVYTPRSLAP